MAIFKKTMLFRYLIVNREVPKGCIKNLSCLNISEDALDDRMCRYIVDNWDTEIKGYATELLENKCPNELREDLPAISDIILVWSKGLVVDEVLDELAKYVIINQITGDNMLSLNSKHLKHLEEAKFKKNPAHRPLNDMDTDIGTLMVYFETGSIRATSTQLGIDRTTVRDRLKKVVGDNYATIKKESHPKQSQIKEVYTIWLSKKN